MLLIGLSLQNLRFVAADPAGERARNLNNLACALDAVGGFMFLAFLFGTSEFFDVPTLVSAGTLLDSKSEVTKLNSGQTDKSQKVSIGSLNQESSGSNAVSFAESVVGAAVRAAMKP